MEKSLSKVKTLVILLLAILLCLVAFGGVYIYKNGIWSNVLNEYKYGIELSGFRELHFVLDETENEKEIYIDENGNYMGDVKEDSTSDSSSDVSLSMTDEEGNPIEDEENIETEEAVVKDEIEELGYSKVTQNVKTNPDEMRTISNFEKTKKIIQERLDYLSINEYNIRQNVVTGEIIVETTDDDYLSTKEGLIINPGKIRIVDYQNGLVLLDDSHMKEVTMQTANTEEGYQLFLIIRFDKYGAEKIREISNRYRTVVNDNEEETTTYVSVNLDDNTIVSTYFGDEITSGALQIPYGQAYKDYSEFIDFVNNSAFLGGVLKGEKLPLKYKLSSDNYINTSPEQNTVIIALAIFAACITIINIVMIIKFKSKSIRFIGMSLIYISLLNLVCRYTNVYITYNSLVAYVFAIVLNYYFYFKLLNNIKSLDNLKLAFTTTLKEYYLMIVPIIAIAIVFTFMFNVSISSIGMLLFWGLILQFLIGLLAL